MSGEIDHPVEGGGTGKAERSSDFGPPESLEAKGADARVHHGLPSTLIFCPVTKSERSVTRNSTTLATSSGCPSRSSRDFGTRRSGVSCGRSARNRAERVPPGEMQFTLMPYGRSCAARQRV